MDSSDTGFSSFGIPRLEIDLNGGEGTIWRSIHKEVGFPASSKRDGIEANLFHVPHPIDYKRLFDLQSESIHHKKCLSSKVNAIVGLGFRDPKVAEILDPLTLYGIEPLMRSVCLDMLHGQGYIEVVREGGVVKGLHHMPNHEVYKVLEDKFSSKWHYEVMPHPGLLSAFGTGAGTGGRQIFARFGDKEDLMDRLDLRGKVDPDDISELIHLPRCIDSSNRHYSLPDWEAAIGTIELISKLLQHQFDWFNNRGVPEMAIVIKGGITNSAFKEIQKKMRATIGSGNQFKTFVIQVGPQNDIVFEKLPFQPQEGFFKEMMETLTLHVVTSHSIPPLLGNIQTPGKLGATNEFPNALQSFQMTCVLQEQVNLSVLLACTLGQEDTLGLTPEMFAPSEGEVEEPPTPAEGMVMPVQEEPKPVPGTQRNGFRTILEAIDIAQADTVSRMRDPLPKAQAEGRDLDEGVQD